jgi:hypothetical protein
LFDDSLLDDAAALARVDLRLRTLAESGSRVRRESVSAAEAMAENSENLAIQQPRAVVAAGPDSRLLRAVLEPVCPVPFVAWPRLGLPGWVGSLDLVVVLAPEGSDPAVAAATAEATRRGCQLLVFTPLGSLVAEHAGSRYTTLIPTQTGDHNAVAVAALELLHRLHLGPEVNSEYLAKALDDVAVDCSPFRESITNPAKILATAMADANPALWGTSPLAARAARRIAEAIRAATGRSALAGLADQLRPMLEAAEPIDVFADPFIDDGDDSPSTRPVLVVLDDGSEDAQVTRERAELENAARSNGLRVEKITSNIEGELARYATMLLIGQYAATYLQVGQTL